MKETNMKNVFDFSDLQKYMPKGRERQKNFRDIYISKPFHSPVYSLPHLQNRKKKKKKRNLLPKEKMLRRKELFERKERSQRDFCMVSKNHDCNLEAFKMNTRFQILIISLLPATLSWFAP